MWPELSRRLAAACTFGRMVQRSGELAPPVACLLRGLAAAWQLHTRRSLQGRSRWCPETAIDTTSSAALCDGHFKQAQRSGQACSTCTPSQHTTPPSTWPAGGFADPAAAATYLSSLAQLRQGCCCAEGAASGGLDIALGPNVGASPLAALGPAMVLQTLVAGAIPGKPVCSIAALPLVRPGPALQTSPPGKSVSTYSCVAECS